MTATLLRWSVQDYHRMIEADLFVNRQVELLNGLVVEMAPEGPEHADLSTDADELFVAQSQGRYRVRVEQHLKTGQIQPLAFPDIEISVRTLLP
jgi:hypothetical protein